MIDWHSIPWLEAAISLGGYTVAFCSLKRMARQEAEQALDKTQNDIANLCRLFDEQRTAHNRDIQAQDEVVRRLQARLFDMAKRHDGMSKNITGLRRTLDIMQADKAPQSLPVRLRGKFRD
jgi:septal ring factor EnvC (AmiA/AmiB activator)